MVLGFEVQLWSVSGIVLHITTCAVNDESLLALAGPSGKIVRMSTSFFPQIRTYRSYFTDHLVSRREIIQIETDRNQASHAAMH